MLLERRVDRAASDADITALVESALTAEMEAREVVRQALAASGLGRSESRHHVVGLGATCRSDEAPKLNRVLQSQPWWDFFKGRNIGILPSRLKTRKLTQLMPRMQLFWRWI